MDSPLITSSIKKTHPKPEISWNVPNTFTKSQNQSNSKSQVQRKSLTYVYALILIEKNIKNLIAIINKKFLLQKMKAFRKIVDQKYENICTKAQHFELNSSQLTQNKKINDHGNAQSKCFQQSSSSQSYACVLITKKSIESISRIMKNVQNKLIYQAWMRLTFLRYVGQYEDKNNSSNQDLENHSMKIGGQSSNILQKRKNTKNHKEDWKQNSHQNSSEVSIPNDKYKNENLDDKFIQEMNNMLDEHAKYLSNGVQTIRGKKNK